MHPLCSLAALTLVPGVIAQAATPQNGAKLTREGPWRPLAGSALTYAKRGDASMAAFRGIEGRTSTEIDYEGAGRNLGELEIRTPDVFRVDYVNMHYPRFHKDPPITEFILRSNGRTVDIVGTKLHRQMPLSSLKFYDAKSVQDWVFGYPKYLLGAFRGEHPLEHLMEAASRNPAAYALTLEIRDVVNQGRRGQQVRIAIHRRGPAAMSQGPLDIHLIVDPTYGIPVEAQFTMTPPGHKLVHVNWLGVWRKNDDFDPKDFKILPLKKGL